MPPLFTDLARHTGQLSLSLLFMLLLATVLYSETHISVLASNAIVSVWPF